ncbi:glycosyltransferase [Streptomyces sp. H27-D2]|uniref:glycosyltransferase n=1 Tax=Streptomyces sp. H27-D2 TaxID=3046304 RepID=UPI002DBBFA1C|nr:glycosyltransferase [Streptomyces sp. H27-D2]MEC4020859.1 glycosyltransferase [Streptomyces sp. H27-D2]
MADRLNADRDELAAFLAPDPEERFTTEELAAADIRLTAVERAEHTAWNRLPSSVARRLTPAQSLDLARLALRRPGDGRIGDRKNTGWNHGGGDLLALLAARVLDVPVVVVRADLGHQRFAPHARQPEQSGNRPVDTAGPSREQRRPEIVLHLQDDLYRAALPAPGDGTGRQRPGTDEAPSSAAESAGSSTAARTAEAAEASPAARTTESAGSSTAVRTPEAAGAPPSASILPNGPADSTVSHATQAPATADPLQAVPERAVPEQGTDTPVLGSGSGPRETVPQSLHFVWVGGEMAPAARANIRRWAAEAAESGWNLAVWTDAGAARANHEFLHDPTLGPHVSTRPISALLGKKWNLPIGKPGALAKARALYEVASARRRYAMASDVARYAILHRHGGVYLDVDLSPGSVRLPRQALTMPNGRDALPMFAPQLRDAQHLISVLGESRPHTGAPDAAEIEQAARHQYTRKLFNNAFIVAPPKSPFLRQLLDALPDVHTKDRLARGLLEARIKENQPAEVTGPNFVDRQLEQFYKPLTALRGNALKPAVDPAELERWIGLGWVTEESGNQEAEGLHAARDTGEGSTARRSTAPPLDSGHGGDLGTLARSLRGLRRRLTTWGSEPSEQGRRFLGNLRDQHPETALATGEHTAVRPERAPVRPPEQPGRQEQLGRQDPTARQLTPERQRSTTDGVFTGTDGRQVTYTNVRARLHEIKDADGQFTGHASHSAEAWAPRERFYAGFRRDEETYAHYRGPEGREIPDSAHGPATETSPWHITRQPADTTSPRPYFFDAHGTERGLLLHAEGENAPVEIDGAQFAAFLDTLTPTAADPAPVVLVACHTGGARPAGGSLIADAAHAGPGRRWYAPSGVVGHATPPTDGGGGPTGVLALLADPASQQRGYWATAYEPTATSQPSEPKPTVPESAELDASGPKPVEPHPADPEPTPQPSLSDHVLSMLTRTTPPQEPQQSSTFSGRSGGASQAARVARAARAPMRLPDEDIVMTLAEPATAAVKPAPLPDLPAPPITALRVDGRHIDFAEVEIHEAGAAGRRFQASLPPDKLPGLTDFYAALSAPPHAFAYVPEAGLPDPVYFEVAAGQDGVLLRLKDQSTVEVNADQLGQFLSWRNQAAQNAQPQTAPPVTASPATTLPATAQAPTSLPQRIAPLVLVADGMASLTGAKFDFMERLARSYGGPVMATDSAVQRVIEFPKAAAPTAAAAAPTAGSGTVVQQPAAGVQGSAVKPDKTSFSGSWRFRRPDAAQSAEIRAGRYFQHPTNGRLMPWSTVRMEQARTLNARHPIWLGNSDVEVRDFKKYAAALDPDVSTYQHHHMKPFRRDHTMSASAVPWPAPSSETTPPLWIALHGHPHGVEAYGTQEREHFPVSGAEFGRYARTRVNHYIQEFSAKPNRIVLLSCETGLPSWTAAGVLRHVGAATGVLTHAPTTKAGFGPGDYETAGGDRQTSLTTAREEVSGRYGRWETYDPAHPQAAEQRPLPAAPPGEDSLQRPYEERFEQKLATALLADNAVLTQFRTLAKHLWDGVAEAQRAGFGIADAREAGAVGNKVEVLRDVVEHGNVRELTTLIHQGLSNGILALPRIPAELLAEKAQWIVERPAAVAARDAQYTEPAEISTVPIRTDIAPGDVLPVLSARERAISILKDAPGGLGWIPDRGLYQLGSASPSAVTLRANGGYAPTGYSIRAYALLQLAHLVFVEAKLPVDMHLIRRGVLGALVQAGHSSFHEVMSTAVRFDAEHAGKYGLGYDDSAGRYRSLDAIKEAELRAAAGVEGLFPDEHAAHLEKYEQALAAPGDLPLASGPLLSAGPATAGAGGHTAGDLLDLLARIDTVAPLDQAVKTSLAERITTWYQPAAQQSAAQQPAAHQPAAQHPVPPAASGPSTAVTPAARFQELVTELSGLAGKARSLPLAPAVLDAAGLPRSLELGAGKANPPEHVAYALSAMHAAGVQDTARAPALGPPLSSTGPLTALGLTHQYLAGTFAEPSRALGLTALAAMETGAAQVLRMTWLDPAQPRVGDFLGWLGGPRATAPPPLAPSTAVTGWEALLLAAGHAGALQGEWFVEAAKEIGNFTAMGLKERLLPDAVYEWTGDARVRHPAAGHVVVNPQAGAAGIATGRLGADGTPEIITFIQDSQNGVHGAMRHTTIGPAAPGAVLFGPGPWHAMHQRGRDVATQQIATEIEQTATAHAAEQALRRAAARDEAQAAHQALEAAKAAAAAKAQPAGATPPATAVPATAVPLPAPVFFHNSAAVSGRWPTRYGYVISATGAATAARDGVAGPRHTPDG